MKFFQLFAIFCGSLSLAESTEVKIEKIISSLIEQQNAKDPSSPNDVVMINMESSSQSLKELQENVMSEVLRRNPFNPVYSYVGT